MMKLLSIGLIVVHLIGVVKPYSYNSYRYNEDEPPYNYESFDQVMKTMKRRRLDLDEHVARNLVVALFEKNNENLQNRINDLELKTQSNKEKLSTEIGQAKSDHQSIEQRLMDQINLKISDHLKKINDLELRYEAVQKEFTEKLTQTKLDIQNKFEKKIFSFDENLRIFETNLRVLQHDFKIVEDQMKPMKKLHPKLDALKDDLPNDLFPWLLILSMVYFFDIFIRFIWPFCYWFWTKAFFIWDICDLCYKRKKPKAYENIGLDIYHDQRINLQLTEEDFRETQRNLSLLKQWKSTPDSIQKDSISFERVTSFSLGDLINESSLEEVKKEEVTKQFVQTNKDFNEKKVDLVYENQKKSQALTTNIEKKYDFEEDKSKDFEQFLQNNKDFNEKKLELVYENEKKSQALTKDVKLVENNKYDLKEDKSCDFEQLTPLIEDSDQEENNFDSFNDKSKEMLQFETKSESLNETEDNKIQSIFKVKPKSQHQMMIDIDKENSFEALNNESEVFKETHHYATPMKRSKIPKPTK